MKTISQITRLFSFLYIIGSMLIYIISSVISKSFALEEWQTESCVFFASFDLLVIIVSTIIAIKFYYSEQAIKTRVEVMQELIRIESLKEVERLKTIYANQIKEVKDQIANMKAAHDYYNK